MVTRSARRKRPRGGIDRLPSGARGLSNRQIGRKLGITERTVKSHLTSAYQRLGVTDRVQAALTYSGIYYPGRAGA